MGVDKEAAGDRQCVHEKRVDGTRTFWRLGFDKESMLVCRLDTLSRVCVSATRGQRLDGVNEDVVAFGADEQFLAGSRPSSIGLWRWIAFQQPCNRYTYWVLRAQAGELPGAYRSPRGKWMVAIDWALIDEIGLIPAIKRMGWVTVPGQLPGQPPGSALPPEPKPEA